MTAQVKPARNLSLHFGALVPSIAEQLANEGLTAHAKDLKLWQDGADALVHLSINGLLPDSIVRASRIKLLKKICANVKVHKI